jgi:hypothetical protein
VDKDRVISFDEQKTVERINVLGTFIGHTGSVCFGGLDLRLLDYGHTGQTTAAATLGDPHYTTLGGERFNL